MLEDLSDVTQCNLELGLAVLSVVLCRVEQGLKVVHNMLAKSLDEAARRESIEREEQKFGGVPPPHVVGGVQLTLLPGLVMTLGCALGVSSRKDRLWGVMKKEMLEGMSGVWG